MSLFAGSGPDQMHKECGARKHLLHAAGDGGVGSLSGSLDDPVTIQVLFP